MGDITNKITKDPRTGETLQILCKHCGHRTNHLVLSSVNVYTSEPYYENYSISLNQDLMILQCLGCNTTSFYEKALFSEADEYKIEIYPERNVYDLIEKDYDFTPDNIEKCYADIITSYNRNLNTLCAAAIRMIIEYICIDKKIRYGQVEITKKDGTKVEIRKQNLEGRICGLAENDLLTKGNTEFLHSLRFMGNKAVHTQRTPKRKELAIAIKIVENLIENIYEIPNIGRNLAKIQSN